ncbi:MAG: 4Fe-4S dicluster domain-containing protein [Desulfobacteraceae bacterium]|nr:4Fe-4S dicluster domain-containing protein [Desulfobacteraceae bacterium]
MTTFQLDSDRLTEGIDRLHGQYRVIGPVAEGRFHNFRPLQPGQKPDFDFRNTRMSAKQLVYPQSQVMAEYHLDETREDSHILKEVLPDETPRAVFGIRPCDADAFGLVRRNFDTEEYKDPYWIQAYERATLVGLACEDPCRSCFCTSAGSGPYSTGGLDALLVEDPDGGYWFQSLTEKGERLREAAGWKEEAGSGVEDTIAERKKAAESRIVSQVHTDQLRNQATLDLYEAPFWEDVAFSCINCGTCTYLCPTCWCFDIQDETHGKKGCRMRNWDSCMYPLFTLHGSGHNPRGEKIQRVRQRFMHKLKYYVDKYDNGIQCVGCGRCVQYCPVNIDIRRVCELMNQRGSTGAACEV